MAERNFREMLEYRWAAGNFVCVGLDSDLRQIPQAARRIGAAETIFNFNCRIVDATADLACAFKPNIAFYEAVGLDGFQALARTIEHIRRRAPSVPIILDAKRADIGSTNNGYVQAAFDIWKADAITVHPYLGAEALEPFLKRADKGIIVLCRTSNAGARELQDRHVYLTPEKCQDLFCNFNGECTRDIPNDPITMPLYQYVAYRVVNDWNRNGNCGVVAGATYPKELREVRQIVGDMPILIPGIGAQGGDLEKTIKAGKDSRGRGMIINSSRGIIFASKGEDFAEAARRETLKLRDAINQVLTT